MSNCDSCPSKQSCSNKDNCEIENNPLNRVNKIIGVMSGKGGVGKSTISVLIAKKLKQQGYKVGVLDADITGPSIPRLFNISGQRAFSSEEGIIPIDTNEGIKTISLNLVIENENAPVMWRGPMIGGAVKQFWTDVLWGELDYLIIDMPPGTGDVALTVMQSIPISGIVMVSVPQDFVSMIVAKAVKMARKLNVKVLGVVENMSYITCPNCDFVIKLFDKDEAADLVKDLEVELLGELPMVRELMDISKGEQQKQDSHIDDIITSVVKRIKDSIK